MTSFRLRAVATLRHRRFSLCTNFVACRLAQRRTCSDMLSEAPHVSVVCVDPFHRHFMFFGTQGRIYRGLDLSTNWNLQADNSPGNSDGEDVVAVGTLLPD